MGFGSDHISILSRMRKIDLTDHSPTLGSPLEMLKKMNELDLQTGFPSVYVALSIYLTLRFQTIK